MLEKELQALQQTEARCREIIQQAEQERQRIEGAAAVRAEQEHNKLTEQAHREGELEIERARAEAAEQRQQQLRAAQAEIEATQQADQQRILPAVEKMIERICSGDDCANESVRPSGAQTG